MKELPSLEYLNERFNYDSETGVLTWNKPNEKQMKLKSGDVAGCLNKRGYRNVVLDGSSYRVHRLCYYMGTGAEPEQVDHINGVPDDNRLENLRSVSSRTNSKNQKLRVTNTSGVMGVTRHTQSGKWHARISQESLGVFTDKIDAIYARYWAERDAGYHENHGRV